MNRRAALRRLFFFQLWLRCLGALQSRGVWSLREGVSRIRLVLLLVGVLAFSGVQRCAIFRALMRPERLPSKVFYQDIPYERRGEPVSLPAWSRVGTYLGEPLFLPAPPREDGRLYLFLGGEPEERFQPYERRKGF